MKFIDQPQKIDDVYENLEDYNLTKKRKVLIVFDDMIAVWKLIKNEVLQSLNYF